jgi:hypothetical protein
MIDPSKLKPPTAARFFGDHEWGIREPKLSAEEVYQLAFKVRGKIKDLRKSECLVEYVDTYIDAVRISNCLDGKELERVIFQKNGSTIIGDCCLTHNITNEKCDWIEE